MPKASTKVWVVCTPANLYVDEEEAIESIRDQLKDGRGLGDIVVVEGYRRELEAQVETTIRTLRIKPVARKTGEEAPS
jgi:molybdopterin-guanine dinucleotide biosynthesis protein